MDGTKTKKIILVDEDGILPDLPAIRYQDIPKEKVQEVLEKMFEKELKDISSRIKQD